MVNKGQLNLQDTFLNQVRKERIPITIYLVNGVQLKGLVRGFDSFTVVVENEGRQSLVYKHAMSTLIPARPIAGLMSELAEHDKEPSQPS